MERKKAAVTAAGTPNTNGQKLPSDNNLAEHSIRPLVTMRKMSGGNGSVRNGV